MKRDDDGVGEERRRDLELGAALAGLPHPELPDDLESRLRMAVQAERRRRRRRRSVATLALAAALAALMLGGAALAGAFDADSPAPWPEPPLPAKSAYPTNAAGQTCGGDKPLVENPDLVKVQATNGKAGYSLKADIYPDADPRTPEEAEEITKRGLRGYMIPVYESDGVTQIGVFQVGGPGSKAVYGRADGTVTMEADADGTIITTTVTADGTTTVERETPDGTVTTKTLTAAEAARLKETRKPDSRPAHRPVQPPAWLRERMSRLARDAGDARATAWWEPQFRYYLKRIEGDKTPASPYQQWATVWLVILHGDFAGGDWKYWLLGQDSHNVISGGASDRAFDASRVPPEGPVKLGGE
jgi:hypothetical protein